MHGWVGCKMLNFEHVGAAGRRLFWLLSHRFVREYSNRKVWSAVYCNKILRNNIA